MLFYFRVKDDPVRCYSVSMFMVLYCMGMCQADFKRVFSLGSGGRRVISMFFNNRTGLSS